MNLHIPTFSERHGQIIPAKYLNPLLATVAKLRKSSRSDFPRRTRRPTLTTADGAAGCGLPLARQPSDTGKSALTSFRGEPVSPTAPMREGFRMTRYQFFHNSYESLVSSYQFLYRESSVWIIGKYPLKIDKCFYK